MSAVCFYFQVHQPVRLRNYSFFDIGVSHDYEDVQQNATILRKVADRCYLPANELMLRLVESCNGAFRISFSITGILMDQLENCCPEVLDSFRHLSDTGCVEFLAETYHHSLAFLYSRREFELQVRSHVERVRDAFGRTPTTLRNTELIYNNEVGAAAEQMGFRAVLAEGADRILSAGSPNSIYRPQGCGGITLLLKNYRLSDDIAFRFSSRDWAEYPLGAEKFARWIRSSSEQGRVVNLFFDYETLGEHQPAESGIFDFFEELPELLLRDGVEFLTPAEAASRFQPEGELDVPDFVSWADMERDLSAWVGNELQRSALESVYALEEEVGTCGDPGTVEAWRRLQISDHFYYMCTKWFADGDVHKYFNPYLSPYDAYVNYMNVLTDFTEELRK